MLGENGAGKSTLLKILSGAYRADAGTIELFGQPVDFATPHDAQRAGVVTIYQEFTLAPAMTIAENVFIGREPGIAPLRQLASACRGDPALAERIGLKRDPMTLVRDLSVAEQQLVEIARALSMRSRIIIMDEPTSALSETEVANLANIIRKLKAEGLSIIFVTHRLEEVFRLCDRYTVLRDGRYVGSGRVADTNVDAIIRMMVGRDVDALYGARPIPEHGAVALEVEGLTRRRSARDPHAIELIDVSLRAHKGEILGLAGLVGAGRTEMARTIFGADAFDQGSSASMASRSASEPARRDGARNWARARGSQAAGLFLGLSIRTNITMPGWNGSAAAGSSTNGARSAGRGIPPSAQHSDGEPGSARGPALRRQSTEGRARALARSQTEDPHRRRTDAGHRRQLEGRGAQLLFDLAKSGIAVIVISSELPEILAISDRIVTMREGRVTGEIARATRRRKS